MVIYYVICKCIVGIKLIIVQENAYNKNEIIKVWSKLARCVKFEYM